MTSKKTAIEVLSVFEKRLKPETIRLILADLIEVKGNKSFEQTIQALVAIYNESHRTKWPLHPMP